MITTCTNCQARYQLDDTKVPPRVIKVRCPACSGVFEMDGSQARTEEPLVSTGYDSVAATPPSAPAATPPAAAVETAPPVREPQAAPAAPEPQVAPAATSVAVMDEPQAAPAKTRRRRSKEEMLARALVSDIKVYNRELYDTAKAEGNLLEALGAEIKKSWELYKEKVTPEVANGTDHFRNALNEILAEGEKVF